VWNYLASERRDLGVMTVMAPWTIGTKVRWFVAIYWEILRQGIYLKYFYKKYHSLFYFQQPIQKKLQSVSASGNSKPQTFWLLLQKVPLFTFLLSTSDSGKSYKCKC
jgi:hypothetical protein